MCDTQGVIYEGRGQGMNEWKEEFQASKEWAGKTLKDALVGADVFIGVSGANLLNAEDVSKMAAKPINICIFANNTLNIL